MEKIYDCAIIGGGPAGITAGIYLTRAGKSVVLFEGEVFVGQMATTPKIENYPSAGEISGFDLSLKMLNDLKRTKATIVEEKVIKLSLVGDEKTIKTPSGEYVAKSVILAMGVRPRQVDKRLEDRFLGRGISYCATCDGNLYKDQPVCIIGGGNSAFSEALYLANLASQVYLVHRSEKFRAEESLINAVKENVKIKMMPNYVLDDLVGEQKVNSVKLKSVLNGETIELNVECVFVSIGRVANSELVVGQVQVDENGFIVSNDCLTSEAGVFVAGDIRTKALRQIVTATSDGAISANLAVKYLNGIK
ncbi:MAG: FAD-dependent oxidoreductase [bacterium]|nr:FAD-dependent oxidoreductase [bacterium]